MNRSEILQKLSAGEITVDEATRLLEGLKSQPEAEPPQDSQARESRETGSVPPPAAPEPPLPPLPPVPPAPPMPKSGTQPKWLHVRVSDVDSDKDRVRINIPIGVFRASKWFGGRFSHKFGMWDEVIDALDNGETGTLVEVEDIESGERVQIYVD
jgi:hypothetical protein